jgi:hypothetical protein
MDSFASLGFSMAQNCTILCPSDAPQQVVACLRDLLQGAPQILVTGKDSDWSKIEIKTQGASLTLNRQVRRKPGDAFSKMVLGMHTYFDGVKTSAKSIKKDILDRVLNMALAIGVVAEPVFVDEDRHYDCIFGIAAAMKAVIWTGSGVINAEGKMLLDGDGNSEVT